MLPLYHLVSNAGMLFPARDIVRSLLIMLWRSAFFITYFLPKTVVFNQSEHRTGYHAVHARALSGIWHLSLIKLFAQSPQFRQMWKCVYSVC